MVRAALLAATLLCGGCYKYVLLESPSNNPTTASDHTVWHSYLLWGLVDLSGDQSMAVCPNGVAKVQVSTNVVNYIVTGLTSGIYGARTDRYWCK